MILEIFVYFFVIFGIFSLILSLSDMYSLRKYGDDAYLVTRFSKKEDKEKIIYFAKKYNHTIYVLCDYYDEKIADYITERYFNVKFIKK